MSGENINLEDKKVEKIDFYKIKRLFKIDEIDVDKILVSKKEPYGTNKSIKYFIGYNMIMLLDHYAWSFLKWLDMLDTLNALIITRKNFFSTLTLTFIFWKEGRI